MIIPLTTDWRRVLRQNFTNFYDLATYLELSEENREALDIKPEFRLHLPKRLAEKMEKNSLADPLFLQFVPLKKEQILHPDFTVDPVDDAAFALEDKLLQKYSERALILATSACAMHCRYCFRKNFDYETEDKTYAKELQRLANDASIEEVILSGGDPLSLSDDVLGRLLENIAAIAHVKRIRFHSRFLMGIPERADESFLEMLKSIPKQIWFINHANHINEFDDDVWTALKSIQKLGIPILNQTVLLNGVNNSKASLKALLQGLVDHGITPYYLHQLDEVQGSSHFKVSIAEGRKLIQELMKEMPGFAIPKYVQEIAGEPSKTPLL